MAIYQIFVKLLDGTTRCLQIPSPTISGETLKLRLSSITNIPLESQRLVTGTLTVSNKTLISASNPDGLFPSCSLLLRLPGGKGGFGSLLRGAATKAGQKKTNNFDACRDMSGRRLRHVNAEKKLEDWRAEAEDRRLERLAEQFLKKKAKEVKKKSSSGVEKCLEKYREDSAKCVEEVEESVRQSFELYKESNRKILPTSGPSKRLKIWLGKKKVDESESEDSDDDDHHVTGGGKGKSLMLEDGNSSSPDKEEEGTSTISSVSGTHSEGGSTGGASAQSDSKKFSDNCGVGSSPSEQGCGSGDDNSDSGVIGMSNGTANQDIVLHSSEELRDLDNSDSIKEGCVERGLDVVACMEAMQDAVESKMPIELPVDPELTHKESNANQISTIDVEEALNFDMYNSSVELEVLGMERLKVELQSHGLKCGGTLQERAGRLFLLKTTLLEKLPKKLLAKPGAVAK